MGRDLRQTDMVRWGHMADSDFYIDKAPEVADRPEKPANPWKGRWWKFGLAFAVIQVVGWVVSGNSITPEFTFMNALTRGYTFYLTFIAFSFLPFLAARFGFRAFMWFSVVCTSLAIVAFHILLHFGPITQFPLLPFASYLQLVSAGVSLGILWEFGKWVFRKVRE